MRFKMKHIEARIKTPFGEVVIEGENPQEILDMLSVIPENFVEKLSDFVSNRLIPSGAQLKGIVELTTEGPVIVTREKLTHYEAVGLILYASEEKKNTAAQITKLLESSGINAMVPARLNEMTKRGQVFKPDPNKPEFKLTIQGEKWVEEEVLSRLRGKMN
jgi:predicted transcriptional regulator